MINKILLQSNQTINEACHKNCICGNNSITSIEVSIFFSLILSYFCFFVPAFRPCQGRLRRQAFRNIYCYKQKGNLNTRKQMILTFLLRNTSAHNQEIPDHLFCFALEGNEERLTQIHLSRHSDLLVLQLTGFEEF